ncbi:MAG TPA: DNA ligase D [Polyangiaceae bacterium]
MSREGIDVLVARVKGMSAQKATLVDELPANSHAFWFELKWDGYRILAVKSGRNVRLISRRQQDFTDTFPGVASAVAELDCEECVIDGEVCAIGDDGMPSFQRLQQRGRGISQMIFAVFDLIWQAGDDLRSLPIEARRAALEALLGSARGGTVILSQQFEGDPAPIFRAACEKGLEGIIAKQRGSKYVGLRATTWLKIKCKRRQEFAIAGYVPLLGHKRAVGGLVLALHDEQGFYFAGKVGTGFSEASRYELAERLEAERVPRAGVRDVPSAAGAVRYCRPKYVCEVEFSEWTAGGHVRHPSFRGLRADKEPEECVREVAPKVPAAAAPAPIAPRQRPAADAVSVAGVGITHPDRVLGPLSLTKLELARYYAAVAEWMLPHVRNRPLGLVQHRRDHERGLYLPHDAAFGPHELERVRIPLQKKTGHYLIVRDVAGLVALANFEIIEVHGWMSRLDDLERPDRLVFDVDPDEALPWKDVVAAARSVRQHLRAVGLSSWPRLTGGKGIHVVVPLTPNMTWKECSSFARAFAAHVQRAEPGVFVTQTGAVRRKGKVLLDVLRNVRASTAIESYSTRARPGTPVCVPLSWDELQAGARPKRFDVASVVKRLRSQGEPWRAYWDAPNLARASVTDE